MRYRTTLQAGTPLNIVQELQAYDVTLKALDKRLDITNPAGKLQLQVPAAVAELEAAIRREREMEGLCAGQRRGTYRWPKAVLLAIAIDIRAPRSAVKASARSQKALDSAWQPRRTFVSADGRN